MMRTVKITVLEYHILLLSNEETRRIAGERDKLEKIIKRALVKFCEDGSDGAIAAEMFSILSEASNTNTNAGLDSESTY